MKYVKYILFVVVIVLVIILFSWFIHRNYFFALENDIMPLEQINKSKSFVVLWGEALNENSELEKSLQSQLDVVNKLYKDNYIKKIILSGDKELSTGNVVVRMADYLVAKNIDISDIILDFYSPDIYSSVLRIQNVYGLDDFYLIGDDLQLLQYLYFLSHNKEIIAIEAGNKHNWFFKNLYKWKSVFQRKLFTPDVYSEDYDPNFLINNK